MVVGLGLGLDCVTVGVLILEDLLGEALVLDLEDLEFLRLLDLILLGFDFVCMDVDVDVDVGSSSVVWWLVMVCSVLLLLLLLLLWLSCSLLLTQKSYNRRIVSILYPSSHLRCSLADLPCSMLMIFSWM